ncbi:MAG: ATP-grasp domain-containing protein [Balneolaceae bacterium]|nr:ATP-grasp domain-containing protein [Balneolaceae bacterium]MCH8549582.1 ATP-grasp domain-containing protein [Balneolaceae bacterium]
MIRALILGATKDQIPLIIRAKEMGIYVIVCTYNPSEPGIALADEYHNVSTTDREAVLDLAQKSKVQHVLTYASDTSGPVAAYVAEELGLPGNPYSVVEMMTDKEKFRTFQKNNGFSYPNFMVWRDADSSLGSEFELQYPFIVKPVDSSGGRGIKKINALEELHPYLKEAMEYSASKRVILEELIGSNHPQVHGNGFVVDGKLKYIYLGDHHFRGAGMLVPVATTWPSSLPNHFTKKIEKEVARFISKAGFISGPINIEARIGENGDIFLIELAARSAGNFVTDLMLHATGFDMAGNYLRVLNKKVLAEADRKRSCVAYYLIHAEKSGRFRNVEIEESLEKHLIKMNVFYKVGEKILNTGSMNSAAGILLLSFANEEEMLRIIKDICDYVSVVVD